MLVRVRGPQRPQRERQEQRRGGAEEHVGERIGLEPATEISCSCRHTRIGGRGSHLLGLVANEAVVALGEGGDESIELGIARIGGGERGTGKLLRRRRLFHRAGQYSREA